MACWLTEMVTEHQPPADHSAAATGEVLVRVEGVGKKFCRDLKKIVVVWHEGYCG